MENRTRGVATGLGILCALGIVAWPGGVLRASAAELASAPPTADWPCFRGPNGNGVVPDWPGGLLDDPKQAKVLWTSEEKNLPLTWGFGEGPSNKNRCRARSGGYAGAVAVGGRVFFQYYIPSGPFTDDAVAAKGQDTRKESWAVEADDVILCMDAATGKTLWKAVFERKALSWNNHRANPYTHPCVVGDRLYTLGCGGKAYCVQTADGKTVWESDTGKGYAAFEKARKVVTEQRTVEFSKAMPWMSHSDSGANSPFLTSVAVASGVVACEDSYRERGVSSFGLVGLDAQTGKQLWHVPDAVTAGVSPMRWVHKGQEFFIVSSGKRLLCIEPKTGKLVWELAEDMLKDRCTPAVDGNYLLAQGRAGPHGPDEVRVAKDNPKGYRGLAGFRLSPEGAKRLWALNWPDYQGNWSPPLIHNGHGYAVCGGGLTCVEMETGKVVAQVKSVGHGMMPLLACNGKLFAGFDVLPLDPAKLASLGRIKVSHELYTPLAISEGRMFVRGRMAGWSKDANPPEPDCFYCVDLRKR